MQNLSRLRSNCGQRIFGGIFLVAGLFISSSALLDSGWSAGGGTPRWLLAIFGLPFLVVGLMTLEVHLLWIGKLGKANVEWQNFWPGLLVCTMGLIIMILSVAESDDKIHAARWVVTVVGVVFFLAGLALVASSHIFGVVPRPISDVAGNLLGLLIVTGFAAVALGLVLGPGDEPDQSTRLCFVPSGVILAGIACVGWFNAFRQFRKSGWPIAHGYLRARPYLIPAFLLALFILIAVLIAVSATSPADQRLPSTSHDASTLTPTRAF
jgi:hypothetical protein